MLKTRFNDGWKFRVNSGGSFPVITDRDIPIQDVLLPHDAVIAVPRDGGNIAAHGNGYFVEQNYVYTKNFILNPADEGKCVWLEFEGVYQNAMVYINESFACRCPYGYSNFYIDATKFVYFHGENSIKVAVKNGVQSGRWYTGGGIYRDVNLMVGDRLHIVPDGVRITCTDVEPEMAILTVDVELEYKGLGQRDVYLVTEILDCQGKVVTKEQNALTATRRTMCDRPNIESGPTRPSAVTIPSSSFGQKEILPSRKPSKQISIWPDDADLQYGNTSCVLSGCWS